MPRKTPAPNVAAVEWAKPATDGARFEMRLPAEVKERFRLAAKKRGLSIAEWLATLGQADADLLGIPKRTR